MQTHLEAIAPDFVQDPFHTFDGDFVAMRGYFERVLTKLVVSRFVSEDDATGADGSYVRWRWEWKLRATGHPSPLRSRWEDHLSPRSLRCR